MGSNFSILVLVAVLAWFVVSRRRLREKTDKKSRRNFRKIDQDERKRAEGLTRQENLSSKQLAQIDLIHQTFQEVSPFSLEELKNKLQQANNIDEAIDLWLIMRDSYLSILDAKKYTDIKTKKEVFQVLWKSAMVPRDVILGKVSVKILSLEDLECVLNDFSRRQRK